MSERAVIQYDIDCLGHQIRALHEYLGACQVKADYSLSGGAKSWWADQVAELRAEIDVLQSRRDELFERLRSAA